MVTTSPAEMEAVVGVMVEMMGGNPVTTHESKDGLEVPVMGLSSPQWDSRAIVRNTPAISLKRFMSTGYLAGPVASTVQKCMSGVNEFRGNEDAFFLQNLAQPGIAGGKESLIALQ